MLDGQRLINIEGAYHQPDTIYFTEIQRWQRVRAGATANDGFTVCMRNGELREYGRTADSRILAAGAAAIRVWALNATVDRNGNRVEYHYTPGPNPADGAFYIDTIRYNVRADGL